MENYQCLRKLALWQCHSTLRYIPNGNIYLCSRYTGTRMFLTALFIITPQKYVTLQRKEDE